MAEGSPDSLRPESGFTENIDVDSWLEKMKVYVCMLSVQFDPIIQRLPVSVVIVY